MREPGEAGSKGTVRRGGAGITRRPSLLLHREEGAAAVEFALISLVLFTVVFGIIQYGLWLSQYEVYQGAAREGARNGAVRGDATAIDNAITQAASPYAIKGPSCTGASSCVSIQVSPDSGATWGTGTCTATTIGQLIKVSWNQSFQGHLFALVPPLPDTKLIQGIFRCE